MSSIPTPRPRIVILSCRYGGGHQRVAEVLADELRRRSPGCHIEIHDYIETFIGHRYNLIFTALYFGSVRWVPWLYRWFYRTTSAISPQSFLQRCINTLGKRRLAAWLHAHTPDLMVCTYCLPAGGLSELKRAGQTEVSCVTVITDHAIHSQWIHPGIDLYLVSSEYVRDGLVAHGIPPERVLPTGIPVACEAAFTPNRQALRRQYGLSPGLPTVLVMVGAYNLMRGALDVCRTLIERRRPTQYLFVCGKDERLRLAVERLAEHTARSVRVFGYIKDVPALMAMSDLLVSKAGGVTTSEALAAELPMILVNPIPGQEEENTAFLQAAGAALVATNIAHLGALVDDLLDHPRCLERLREGARRVKRPEATPQAAAAILSLAPACLLSCVEDHADGGPEYAQPLITGLRSFGCGALYRGGRSTSRPRASDDPPWA